jgi:hypothetical protein
MFRSYQLCRLYVWQFAAHGEHRCGDEPRCVQRILNHLTPVA